ncbi:MAG: hypothetical protein RR877_00970 [Aurantimicrobium sp.]|uniref:hypothetical protein n=1 Tax=Aurantimicrobium sp. TaxID=1930784 RepID=UPI002FCB8F2D
MADYTYPEDRTGTRASNLITGEEHVLTPDNHRNFHFIIPKFAPFYAESVKLFKSINGTLLELKEGIDYHFSLEYVSASLSTGKPVYGGISFVDLSLDAKVVLQQYRTVGGQWTLNTQEMLETIANIVFNPRKLTWDQISGKPVTFGPTDHTFDFNNLLTEKQIGDKLRDIRDAILTAAQANTDHENRMDNPHNVSAIQLGVGAFYQKGIATITEALDGKDPDKVITASVLKSVLESLGIIDLASTVSKFNAHLDRIDNPHEVISQQLDLDLVENLEVANLSDVLSKRKVRKYVTLDALMDYIRIHGCATADEDKRKYPVKDSLLSSYCKVRDNMGIYADGYGGTYEKIIENNSASCGYVPPPSSPQHAAKGTILTRYCVGFEQHGLYADGYGGTYSNFIAMNSPACGYTGDNGGVTHPPAGTILGQYCDGTTQVQTKANGSGGSYEDRVPNSSACTSNTTYPPNGTLMSTYCDGTNQMGRYADGKGGTYNAVVQANSSQCGWVSPTPAPTPPPPTQPPVTPPPTLPPSNNPTVSYTITTGVINVNTWDANFVQLAGFTPNSAYSVEFWMQGPGAFNGIATKTTTVNGNVDASGRATIDKGVTAAGVVPAGNYDVWVVEARTNIRTNKQVKQYGENLGLSFSTSKSIAKGGDTYRLTTSLSGGRPNSTYTVTIMERGSSFGSRAKQTRTISTSSNGTGSDYVDIYYDGSTAYSGSVFMWAELSGTKSNEISVTFTPNSTPAPTPAPTSAPPPASNFRAVFSTYLGASNGSSPHTEVPTSQRMGIDLNAYGGGSVGVGVLNSTGWSNSLSKTYALALTVLPKSRVIIQIEVLDASGTIVLARSNPSNVNTNEVNNGWFECQAYTGIPGNVLAAGMNYIVRIVATNVNSGEVTRSANYNAYCFSTPVYEGGG